MSKFQNKYRIPSTRLQNWDYSWAGLYFITICTENREHYFGVITNGKITLSEIGEIVECEWLKTFEMRPDMNLWMGEYVVMPNHFHAIIGIGENKYNSMVDCDVIDARRRDAMHRVSTNNHEHNNTNQFGPQSKNLASIVRGFKSSVTVSSRKINHQFAWQPRFHDRIIHNDKSFQQIQNYIKNNVSNWNLDNFFANANVR
jgi:REP element-mobilizing transposase RayT